MNIKQAKDEIKNTVKAYLIKENDGEYKIPAVRQRPILLMGPPGVGKTQIIEQIARECRIGLVSYTITHHTRQSAVGLPFIVKEKFGETECSVTEYTMSEIIASVYRKIRETGLDEGILFIDEINCVSETLAPTMLQFLQCKTFGNQEVPKGWVIVAAGNPSEFNKSVREFDMVTLDRVRRIDINANFDIWKTYALENNINSAIISYLELRPQNFYRIENDVDGMRFVTARGWEDLSNLMDAYQELNIEVSSEVIMEFLQHEEIAKDVAAYIDLYNKYRKDYEITDILDGKAGSKSYARLLQASFDERLSVVNLLLSGLNNIFRSVSSEKYITDQWYEFLKQYSFEIKQCDDPVDIYQSMVTRLESDIKSYEKSGFYSRRETSLVKCLLSNIRKYLPQNSDNSFAKAKSGFDIQRETLENTENKAGQMLENVFDFMESAFPDGQEMVVFVTELTLGKDSSAFLSENECKRYLNYNKELLTGTRKSEIINELNVGNIRENEHISIL